MRRTLRSICLFCAFLCSLAVVPVASAAPPASRGWMVLLNDPPVVQRFPGRIEITRSASDSYRTHIRQVQANMRAQIEARNVRVTGAVQHILNALFVRATPAQAASLRSLPGVKAVLLLRRFHLEDQLSLSNVQKAWSASVIGGQGNAGAGLKIGILDTGIDQTHPSFQDSSLKIPAGFPKCGVPSDCAFTNNKVIVARSYVHYMAEGSDPNDPAADSRPDDLSARDLTGHGTAVGSVAAGVPIDLDGVALSGVAPKAFLGSYKIYGSPEVNNGSSEGAIIQALDDAVTDGMDVINFSSGAPAFSGPLDIGVACGNPLNAPCDPIAMAVDNLVKSGSVTFVASAGNEGDTGYRNTQTGAATFGTIASPADAPSAIAVGAVDNDVAYAESVQVTGNNVPSDLARIAAFESGDGVALLSPFTAPLADVVKAGNADGLLCTGLPAGSLAGMIALARRGVCTFDVKVLNAQNAGAAGIIFINNTASVLNWGGIGNTNIPAFLVFQTDGESLQSYIDANPGAKATLDPNPSQVSIDRLGFVPNALASFSSRGPATGTNALKPDLVAVGTDFLLAAQDVDPFGDLYSPIRYAIGDGTSFSSPMVAGAAALVKQANPNLKPLQIKSALVNTATPTGPSALPLKNQGGIGPASISEIGAGLLQAQNAVISTVQIVPSSVSFGLLTGTLPPSQTLALFNTGTAAVNLSVTVKPLETLTGTQVQVDQPNLAVPAGGTASLTVSLSGNMPAPGRHEGAINIAGAPTDLHIAYMFLVGNNTPYDVITLSGPGFDGPVSRPLPEADGPLAIRVIDSSGAPVQNAPVQWAATRGGGIVEQGPENTSTTTDQNGVAFASVSLGPDLGTQEFTATTGGLVTTFDGTGRNLPAINANGIVDGASFTQEQPVAPGSIISVFGTGLADFEDAAFSLPLPLGLDGVAFSFDVPSAHISVPAHFFYSSPHQLNIQVPWEVAGQSSAIVKVILGYNYSAEYKLPLATYSPGFFAYAANGQLMAAALDTNNKTIGSSNPIARGATVEFFLNGLGPVNHQPASGAPGPADGSATTTSTPIITIGGQAASVSYSGLAPGLVGLYQVNAVVPQGIVTGAQPVTCAIGGLTSKTVFLIVK